VTVHSTLVATRRITRRKTEYDMSLSRAQCAQLGERRDAAPVRLWRENSVLKESIAGTPHRQQQLRLGRAR
jgi:hypothetical protein